MARTGILAIAKRCGVSHMTVSRILTGKADLHSTETVARVRKAAAEMGYRPNVLAQSMQSGRTRMIGVVVRASHGSWFSDLQGGIHDHLVARGYLPLTLEMSDDSARNMNLLHHMLGRRVEGLVLWHFCEDVMKESVRAGLPVVMVDTPHPRGKRFDFVGTDDALGGRLAAEHLLGLGHRRVAVVSFKNLSTMRSRRTAFSDAIRGVSGAGCRNVTLADQGDEGMRTAIRKVLSARTPPTAVFAGADRIAWMVMREARVMGLNVPEALSVVGYADLDFAEMITPPLTTIRQSPRQIGSRAADLLLDRIETGTPIGDPREVLLKPTLVIRESTAPPS